MMSFFEDYLNKEINFCEEIENLEYLLRNEQNQYGDCVNKFMTNNFLRWKLRGTSVSFGRFKNDFGINRILDLCKHKSEIGLDDFLKYLEYVINITLFCASVSTTDYGTNDIILNLGKILDKIGFRFEEITIQDKKIMVCIEKDFKVRESAEVVNDKNLAEKIFLYKHYSIKGNLYEKAIILSRLYMYFEGIKNDLLSNNYKDLAKIVSNLSNKLNVRHKPNKREELIIQGFTNEELEKAYDSLFDTYLSCIILYNHIKQKPYLEELTNKFNEKETK